MLVCVEGGTGPGITVQRGRPAPPADGLQIDAERLTLENDRIRAKLDAAGRVVSLVHKASGREVVPAGEAANQLVLYDDRPMAQEGWAVDIFYRERATPLESPAEIRAVEEGPWRIAFEVRRTLGVSSEMVQRVELARGGDALTFDTRVEWSEARTMLRVLNPADVRTDHATFEIQYGHVRRPNHMNTSWDVARFESPAQRWADLSEAGFGLTVMNDCKYGHSALGNVLGLSLLRGPREPDEAADIGTHRFRYALRPHGGFDAAEATRAAEAFNEPLTAWPIASAAADRLPPPPFSLDGPHAGSVAVEATKPAEDGDGLILRIRESLGGRGDVTIRATAGRRVEEVDLLERPLVPADAPAEETRTLRVLPFEIRTFRLRPSIDG